MKKETLNWIDNNVDINLCEMEATQKELADLGIKARIVPFPPQTMYEPKPLPEKFAVAVYQPYNNAPFYFPEITQAIAKKMPEVSFHLFGDPMHQGGNENVAYYGVCNKKEMEEVVDKTSMILRLTPHDGLPLSVVEWIMAGRNAITTTEIPYAESFKMDMWKGLADPTKEQLDEVINKNVDRLVEEINKMKDKGQNLEGAKYYKEIVNEDIYRKTINDYLNLDIKKWWETMSKLWPAMEQNQETTDDISKILTEIRKLKPESIVDIGCGTGRWADLLGIEDYTGIDFSEELIKNASEKHPDKKFIATDILNYKPEIKHDVAFTFASLLHVKPDEFKKNVEALKGIARTGVFIEPVKEAATAGQSRNIHPELIKMQKETDFIFNVKYTWIHDYLNEFECLKVIPLSHNRNMFIVKL
jgi:SAM-dependent methyltransferase